MPQRRLPIVPSQSSEARPLGEGSLGRDGHRRKPYPADVRGRFLRARRAVYAALIVLWAALPWISIGGHPALFLDIESRLFFIFGKTFNAQDVWLMFFALSGIGFALVYATAVLGRVWCGWMCPHAVFLEAVFRPIERLIQGPRNVALRREKGEMNVDKVARLVAMHVAYILCALLVAHIVLAYFVSLPRVFQMVRTSPGAHPEAFAWMAAVSGIIYVHFAFFREQLCVVVCPYGRLQSVLLDDDSLVVGYDRARGEPRGKRSKEKEAAGSETLGDCVECDRCVVTCPTGIDIREGLQLDCIACTACIDACDEVMDKLKRPRGLIRYDSLRGLRGEPRRILRPRLYVYTVLLVIGVIVATFAFRGRKPFEANIVRLAGAPYTRSEGTIRNAFEFHLVNKDAVEVSFDLEPAAIEGLTFMFPMQHIELPALGARRIPFFVTATQSQFAGDRPFVIHVHAHSKSGTTSDTDARAVFLGARQ
jgi:cytochrome c oxidase accessory protein FixG